jgi:hypothetical protein
MNMRGTLTVTVLVLAGSFSAAAQEHFDRLKVVEDCVGAKVQVDAISERANSEFVPIRSTAGDLNADSRDEVIVLVRYVGKSSGRRPDEIVVYEMEGSAQTPLTRLQIGRAGEYVLSIESFESNFKVGSGLLFVDLAVVCGKKTATAKHFLTVVFRFNGAILVESERSDPKPLPEHMREIG